MFYLVRFGMLRGLVILSALAVLAGGCIEDEPPDPPASLAATAGNSVVELRWGLVQGADRYNLYWANETGVTPATGTQLAAVTSPYTHKGLTNGTTYYYVVTAENGDGESSRSIEDEATPLPPLPGTPQNVTATAGDAETTVSWSAVSRAKVYNLYWSKSAGVTSSSGKGIFTGKTTHNHMRLTNGITYYYAVSAENVGGEGTLSDEVSATPRLAIPRMPGGLTISADTSQTTLSWNGQADADTFNLYWATTPGVTPANSTQIAGATSPYVHTGLTDGTSYYYVLTAATPASESSPTPEVGATPEAPAADAPSGFALTAGVSGNTLSWDPYADATGFTLYWANQPGVTPATGTQIADVASPFTHTALTDGLSYFYCSAT